MASYSFSPSTSTALDPGVSTTFTATGTAGSYERFVGDGTYPKIEVIVNGSVVERATGSMFSPRTVSITCNVPSATSFTVKASFKIYNGDEYITEEPSATYSVNLYTNCYWDSGASSTLSASQATAGTYVTLSWNTGQAHAGRNNPISAYYIYRNEYNSSSASWGAWELCAQSTGSSCYVTAPSTVGNQYQFAVQIIGANGYHSTNYAYSGTLTAKGTITNFNVTSITPTRTSAVIQWSQPTYNNAQPAFSYTCYVSGGNVAISGRSATVTGLTKGRSYNYTITASYDGVTATLNGSFSTKNVATVKYCADGNSFAEYEVWYCEDGTNFVSMDVYVSDGGPYYLCSF